MADGEDKAIEIAYELVRGLVDQESIDILDIFLQMLDVDRYVNAVLLSLLTATAFSEVYQRLPSRPSLYSRIRDCIIRRVGPSGAEELLVGLA